MIKALLKLLNRITLDHKQLEQVFLFKSPFSVKLMDASFDYSKVAFQEIKKYCKEKFNIYPEEIICLEGIRCKEKKDDNKMCKSEEKSNLYIYKKANGNFIVYLLSCSEIEISI